jgi:ribosome-associated translation inhibitor RaiA
MQVQVNTGNGLSSKETLETWATDFLNESLARFRDELTRVEVQLTDEARGKQGPNDMRCMLEARLTGHAPVAVNHNAENMDEAIRGATAKLIRSLEHTFGKLDRHEHRTRDTIRRDPEAVEMPGGESVG